MGTVIVSGLPNDAAFQDAGMPFSLAIDSSDMARTSDETPMRVSIKNEAQATTLAIEPRRRFMSFCLAFFDGML